MLRVLVLSNLISHRGTMTAGEELAGLLERDGCSLVSASRHLGRVPRLADMLYTTWHHRAAYDVAYVDVYSGKAFALAEITTSLLTRLGKPFVLNLQGGKLAEFGAHRPRRLRRVLGRAAHASAPSEHHAEGLRPFRSDIAVIPNGVSLERYPFRERTEARPRLVWVRAFQAVYAPTLAVRVLADLVEAGIDATLTMIGPDKGDGSLGAVQAEAERSGVRDRLRLPGPVDKQDVPRWLDEGDIFLNTSRVDSFSVTVLEAMACGMCVVSADTDGPRALIDDGASGLLVGVDDAEATSEAVRRLLDDAALASRISSGARERAGDFDWSEIVGRWKDVLRAASR